MFAEKNLKEALQAFRSGYSVLVMEKPCVDDQSGEWTLTELESLFKGSRFLVDVPAPVTITPGIEVAFKNKGPSPRLSVPDTVTDHEKCLRKKVDTGKLIALHRAGWSGRKIAEEMGIHEGTVSRYIKGAKDEGTEEEKSL